MTLPFVSRASFDLAIQQRQEWSRIAADATARAEAAERRADALTERLLSLKMQGAVEVPKAEPAPSVQQVAAPEDPMLALIAAQSGGNLRKRAMMLRQLTIDRAEGRDDDAIRDAILNGVPSDGVPG